MLRNTMVYKKYLIITHRDNIAGMNIINNLEQFRKNQTEDSPVIDVHITEGEALYNQNLPLEKINGYDFVIFAYTHKSDKGTKSLSVHAPGNWRAADLGGEQGKVCLTSALFQKSLFENLNKFTNDFDLYGYEVTMEVTHHGPLINKPCLFIEIGSDDEGWKNRRAGFIVAKTIAETIRNFKPNEYREIAIGIGGPHYCPVFNKIQLNSNVAISHIIPTYATPISEEMIREAIQKTDEELDFVVIDWKAFNSEERQRIIALLEKMYINYKKSSEIQK